MTLFPTFCEIYFSGFALLLIGSAFVGRFNLRPTMKLKLSRLLLLVSVLSPVLMQGVTPAEKPVIATFVSMDLWDGHSSTSPNKELEPESQTQRPKHILSQVNSRDYQKLFLLFLLVGVCWRLVLLIKDLRKIRSLIQRSWQYRSVGALQVRISDQCLIPFSFRWFGAAYIVLPMAMVSDPGSVKIAIAHEGQHHRQGDCLFAYVTEIICMFFFWNPAIGRWKRVLSELQEFSCDEALVGHQIVSPHDYGRCLYMVGQTVSSQSQTYQREYACAVGMAQECGLERQSILRRRIAMLSEYQAVGPRRMLFKSVLVSLSISVPFCAAFAARGSFSSPVVSTVDTADLDPKIQAIAKQEIFDAVDRFKAKSGAIAVADAETGRILAFAEMRNDLNAESWSSRRFVPASTIKPFIAAAAIEAGVASEDKRYDCRQPYAVGGKEFNNYDHSFSELSATDALAKSVNVCLIKMAQDTGRERLKQILGRFGFDIGRSESLLASDKDLELAQLAIGDSLPVGLAQMTGAFAVLANNGHRVNHEDAISETTAASIQRMLVVAVKSGTGKKAALPGLRVGGKTGTMTVDPGGDSQRESALSVFGGFVSNKTSSLVAFVIIEDGHHFDGRRNTTGGGVLAAPVFRNVMKKSLKNLN